MEKNISLIGQTVYIISKEFSGIGTLTHQLSNGGYIVSRPGARWANIEPEAKIITEDQLFDIIADSDVWKKVVKFK